MKTFLLAVKQKLSSPTLDEAVNPLQWMSDTSQ